MPIKCSHPQGLPRFLELHTLAASRFYDRQHDGEHYPSDLSEPLKRLRQTAKQAANVHNDCARAIALLKGSNPISEDYSDRGSVRWLTAHALPALGETAKHLAVMKLEALRDDLKKSIDGFNAALPVTTKKLGAKLFQMAGEGRLKGFDELADLRGILPAEFSSCIPLGYRMKGEVLDLVKSETKAAWRVYADTEEMRRTADLRLRKAEARQRRVNNVKAALKGLGEEL